MLFLCLALRCEDELVSGLITLGCPLIKGPTVKCCKSKKKKLPYTCDIFHLKDQIPNFLVLLELRFVCYLL